MVRLFWYSPPENFQNLRNVLKGTPKFPTDAFPTFPTRNFHQFQAPVQFLRASPFSFPSPFSLLLAGGAVAQETNSPPRTLKVLQGDFKAISKTKQPKWKSHLHQATIQIQNRNHWNIKDLPKPVGKTTRTSFSFSTIFLTASLALPEVSMTVSLGDSKLLRENPLTYFARPPIWIGNAGKS